MNLGVGSDFGCKPFSEVDEKSSKLNFHVYALQEEMRKIEGFKRELPNCMHLLKHAIKRLKEESQKEMGQMMEEFSLFKEDGEGDRRAKVSNDLADKKNWMSSVQLWSSSPVQFENNFVTTNQDSLFLLKSGHEERVGNETQFQGSNFRNRAGAFVPFKKPSNSMREKEGTAPIDGLSLSIPDAEVESTVKGDCGIGKPKLQQPHLQEQQRKQRRCWSPELHKRFVDALYQLGGANTATPKQIREVMKVDGLTNDEVKSHLQKYRIHIKKLPAGSSNYSSQASDQCEDFSKPMVVYSGSPQGPLHDRRPAKGGGSATTATGGDSVEEEDSEDKSENHGWKSPSPDASYKSQGCTTRF